MAERRIYLLAAGGHASVVLDALLASGVRVAGILDPARKPGESIFGVAVLGDDGWLAGREPGATLLANGAGQVPRASLRQALFEGFKARGFGFVSVLHPSAVVGREAELAEGSQVMAGAVVQCRARIGRNAVVNTRASVDHDCIVGEHAFVGPGATLCGDVRVGDGAFVGSGAVVLPGVAVGARAIVGGGALVARDVPEGALVTGVPAAARRERSE
ncbi:MAG: acetyltransferase [Betaproteobacteria bacterium]|nr:acetyltransferase [Betaproteobacteria bacterium]